MRIEILTFEGCPNAAVAHDRVMRALALEGAIADVEAVEVATPELAEQTRFLGSPSVRVNGKDVETGAEKRGNYGLMCRAYHTNSAIEGAPSTDLIRAAIRSAR